MTLIRTILEENNVNITDLYSNADKLKLKKRKIETLLELEQDHYNLLKIINRCNRETYFYQFIFFIFISSNTFDYAFANRQ